MLLTAVAMTAVAALAIAPRADAFIYWANTGPTFGGTTIGRANLDGGGVNQSFITGANAPCGVAVDATHIYWANNRTATSPANSGTVARANIDGTGANQSIAATNGNPCGVAVNSVNLFWADADNHTIGRSNLNGGVADPNFITGSVGTPCGMAVDGGHIYWGAAEGAVRRADLNGMNVEPAFIAGSAPCGVAVDASHIYWANFSSTGNGTTIGRANLDGTGVNQSFISGAAGPCGVAVDGTHIYWGNFANDTIGRANLDGTNVQPAFISGATAPCGVAVDARTPGSSEPPVDPPVEPPSNQFSFGKVKRNKRKGTAKLPVNLPGPGSLVLEKTKKLKGAELAADGATEVLTVKPRGRADERLDERGKAKVNANVTFTPTGGAAAEKSKRIKLVEKP